MKAVGHSIHGFNFILHNSAFCALSAAFQERLTYPPNGNRTKTEDILSYTSSQPTSCTKANPKKGIAASCQWLDVASESVARTTFTPKSTPDLNRIASTTSATWSGPAFTNESRRKFTPDSSTPVQSFSYDPNGNLTSDAQFSYTYDWANRLTSATLHDRSLTLSYSWDPLGRRVKETRTDSSGNTQTTNVTHAGDTAVSLSTNA